ncbi:MAG: hypothetical protein GXO47_11070 [Chlorobi bacterium]|nr:hypothetical protein [Chlorobiota bacterium]
MRQKNNTIWIKMNKQFSGIALLLFMVVNFSTAQNPLTLYHLENIPQSLTINPAMVPDSKFFIGFPVFNSVYTGVNFELTSSDFIQEHNGKYITLTNADFDYGKLYDKIGKAAGFSSYQTLTPVLFGFKLKKGFFTFGWTEKVSESLSVPKDFFKILDKGLPEGSEFDFSKLGADAKYYRELSFGYAFKPMEKLQVGVSAKFLQGLAALKTDVDELSLTTGVDEWIMNIHGSTDISGPVYVSYDEYGVPSFDSIPDDIGDLVINFSNPGFSFDFGAVYDVNEKMQLSASLTDVGMIFWGGDDLNTFYANGEYVYTGIDVNNDNVDSLDNAWDDLMDSIKTNVDFTHGSDNFVTGLGPKLYLGARYTLNDYFSFGAVSRTVFSKYDFRQDFNLSANFNVKRILTTSLNYSVSINGANALGAGFGVKIWPVQLYVAMDYVPLKVYKNITVEDDDEPDNPTEISIVPANLKNFSVMFGLNLMFGSGDKDSSSIPSGNTASSKKKNNSGKKKKK